MKRSSPTLVTWCGSHVTMDQMPKVLAGWQSYARRLERQLKRFREPKLKPRSLEFQLCEILSSRAGEHNCPPCGEGAVDVLCRIIRERDRALKILALDRLKERI